jgi:DNA-nicking Smr family endonuclease
MPSEEEETIELLKKLVRDGTGFVVSDTAEYMEGVGFGVHPEIAKRLHNGEYSVQAHLDLHGFNVMESKDLFDDFLKCAIQTRKQTVLIVHGRGLSSPDGPILKKKVHEWIVKGKWRKWILAFTSARLCDGGTGATYVMLRRRPLTKSLLKNNHRKK